MCLGAISNLDSLQSIMLRLTPSFGSRARARTQSCILQLSVPAMSRKGSRYAPHHPGGQPQWGDTPQPQQQMLQPQQQMLQPQQMMPPQQMMMPHQQVMMPPQQMMLPQMFSPMGPQQGPMMHKPLPDSWLCVCVCVQLVWLRV